MELLIYLFAGSITGVLSGLFGVGGGLIIVPILTFLFLGLHFPEAHIMHMALGTSLATIILTSISSARAHHHKHNVNWAIVKKITPGIVAGTLLGSLLATQLHSNWLKIIFVIFGFFVAMQLFFDLAPSPHRKLPGIAAVSLAGALIGLASSFVGIGGGTLSVPYLVYCNVGIRKAIGTSAAIGLAIAVAGTSGFVIAGWNIQNLPRYSSGFIYLPAVAGIAIASIFTAPVGANLAHRLPPATLKRLFATLLVIVGMVMLWDSFGRG
jgi:uncharacterized membrane protein YfcA